MKIMPNAGNFARLGVLCIGVTSGCGVEVIEETGGDPVDSIPPAVQAALDRSCATSSCHSSKTRAGELSLAPGDADAIFTLNASDASGLAMLELGNIEGSYLALKMLAPDLPSGTSIEGTPMPPIPTEQSKADVALILDWIDTGVAPDASSETTGDDESSVSEEESESATPDTGSEGECFGPDIGQVDPDEIRLRDHIVPIFAERCSGAGCHVGDSTTVPHLGDDEAAGEIIDVDASSAEMKYVTPGSPDTSYLWHKIVGTHSTVPGGGGLEMPFGTSELCIQEIEAIYAWILAGAMP